MHDPDTLIKSLGPFCLWHHDPCTDHTDDSCGWFMRARHGDEAVVKRAVERLEWDWDRTYKSSEEDYADDLEEYGPHNNAVRFTGMFRPNGEPVMSTSGIVLNIYFAVLFEVMKDRRKVVKYLNAHLAEILFFAENPCDSMHSTIRNTFGNDLRINDPGYKGRRIERIESTVRVVYGDVLRTLRPWWKAPRWHVHHWKLTCRPFWKRSSAAGQSNA